MQALALSPTTSGRVDHTRLRGPLFANLPAGRALRWFTFAWVLLAPQARPAVFEPGPTTPLPLPAVSNGLIRWWPNPGDGREEVSGTEGTRVGLLAPEGVDPDPYDFDL
jgi:hypothetical protein